MITLKTEDQLIRMRRAGQIVADTLRLLRDNLGPGVDTYTLDALAYEHVVRCGGRPAFKGYRVPGIRSAFPGTLCISVNDEVVHGIPDRTRRLEEGDIVSFDMGVEFGGYYGDAACTYGVGKISETRRKLMEHTLESLHRAVAVVRDGATVGDIGYAVESYVIPLGYGLVRNYAGHGIGRKLHEPPQVPNYGRPGSGVTLKKGMTIAIEPMVMTGGEEVVTGKDGWTVLTADHSDAAHFEHTVLVCESGSEILTPWES
ncbi:MAG: type I methionyl aminopeptidase [Synergistaceae bacterium]|jgi:methionyl aminopeptidase|nr:type I methionyl aminopeptidase [Synergistaceae bacterium]